MNPRRSSAAIVGILFAAASTTLAQSLLLPARPASAPSGQEFAGSIKDLSPIEREERILDHIRAGHVPEFLRQLTPVTNRVSLNGREQSLVFFVTPDYLAVGRDDDYFLTPMQPATAQRIADLTGCLLPTTRLVDLIYSNATVKLAPQPLPPNPAMTSVPVFQQHNAMVRTQRMAVAATYPSEALVAGHKKDVVISVRLADAPGKVAIYGWHQANGHPIQPLYTGHTNAWVDYSHGVRLVHDLIWLNGTSNSLRSLLADTNLCPLVSAEGPVVQPCYLAEDSPAKTAPRQPDRFGAVNAFNEQTLELHLDHNVRVVVNASADVVGTATNPVTLIFYGLPNGNTIEQTAGKRLRPGDDWHLDIQHIAAQTRFLRALHPGRRYVVAYLENSLKSWPAWRKQHGDTGIPAIIEAVRSLFPSPQNRLILSGHSGGGSLIFGFLNSVAGIPGPVERIAFLDANYAYDPALQHDRKLIAWLERGPRNSLCVLAYNDAVALLDGKPFVSATGGTWGRSLLMQTNLAAAFSFHSQTNNGLILQTALDGRIQLLLKENPDRAIFHTVQVEKNGFIQAMLSGTEDEGHGYVYFGARAYEKWIDAP